MLNRLVVLITFSNLFPTSMIPSTALSKEVWKDVDEDFSSSSSVNQFWGGGCVDTEAPYHFYVPDKFVRSTVH